MRYIAAYVLAVMGGNPSPTAEDIKAIVSSVGIDIDEFKLNKVISELQGKDLEELIAQGGERLASAFVGGGVGVGVGVASGEAEEKKDEEKTSEAAEDDKEESSDEDFGMNLFDM